MKHGHLKEQGVHPTPPHPCRLHQASPLVAGWLKTTAEAGLRTPTPLQCLMVEELSTPLREFTHYPKLKWVRGAWRQLRDSQPSSQQLSAARGHCTPCTAVSYRYSVGLRVFWFGLLSSGVKPRALLVFSICHLCPTHTLKIVLFSLFLFRTKAHHVAQAGLEPVTQHQMFCC